ncbi:hypothetical protein, partial [Mesorhizobium sp.]|uniref:hypothetical protein n=1 Tax=Mesorhizobium sp. TaxID=1871066 RepID=UPI0025DC4524
ELNLKQRPASGGSSAQISTISKSISQFEFRLWVETCRMRACRNDVIAARSGRRPAYAACSL